MPIGVTSKELRAKHVRLMGPDLGRLWQDLQDESEWLRQKWNEFQELFGKGPERIELLNKVASNFFYFVKKLMFEDAMLHLCRLTDPPKTGNRRHRTNLTLMRLAELIPDPTLKAQVQTGAEKLRSSCQFARRWRDKQLAHTDLETYRKGHASPLPGVTSGNIEEALKSVCALLNSVEQHYGLPPSALAADPWGARSLVHYLEGAVRGKDNGEQPRSESV